MQQKYQKFQEEASGYGQKVKQKAQEVSAGLQAKLQRKKEVAVINDNGQEEQINAVEFGDTIPAKWKIVENHQKAWRVGQEDPAQNDVCPCCARQINRISLGINCHQKDMAFLGSGIPLYFDFIRGCIIILLVFFVTSGDYNIITNLVYGEDCQGNDDCPENWPNVMSLANKRNNQKLIAIQQLLNLVSIVSLVAIFQIIRKDQKETNLQCDTAYAACSDYTLLVTNIPKDPDALKQGDFDDDLKQYFLDVLESEYPINHKITKNEHIRKQLEGALYKPYDRVHAVNLCYNLDEQNKHQKEKDGYILSKQKLLAQYYKQGMNPGDEAIKQQADYKDIEEKIKQCDVVLEELEEKFQDGKSVQNYFLGMAFVIFQYQDDRDRVLENNTISLIDRCRGNKSPLIYNGVKLDVRAAPEPTDVYWQNLHITIKSKVIRRIIGLGLTILVLALCTIVVYYLTELQTEQSNIEAQNIIKNGLSEAYGQQETPVGILPKVLSYSASILIVLVNVVLAKLITKVTLYEGFSTQTGYNISLAMKSGIAQFCNTALITFLIAVIISKNVTGPAGLVYNQTHVFLMNFLTIVTDTVDTPGLTASLMQWWEKRKGTRSLMTQLQLDLFMEKPPLQISDRYAVLIKNMFITAFYASLIPLSLMLTSLQLCMFLWVERLNITKRRTIKYNYGPELSTQMTELLEFILPIYCLTNLFWQDHFQQHETISIFPIIGILIGVANALLPMDVINDIIFPAETAEPDFTPITQVEDSFNTVHDLFTLIYKKDYMRENPATAERAKEDFVKKVEKHKKLTQQLQSAAQMMPNSFNQMIPQ